MTSDFAKQYQVMSLIVTPTPVDGVVAVNSENPLLCVAVIDPNNAPPYTYQWTQGDSAPPGATFETPTSSCSYIGPLSLEASYPITITVTNAQGDTASLTFTLTSTNDVPIVNAGSNTTVSGAYVMEASASDPQGRSLTYSWVNTAVDPPTNPLATITTTTILDPLVSFGGYYGTYTFVLTVSNGRYAASSTVVITVANPTFAFRGSFLGISNPDDFYGSPAFYFGLAQLHLGPNEVAYFTWGLAGGALYHVRSDAPDTVVADGGGPYIGNYTWTFYGVIGTNSQNTAANPTQTYDMSASVTVVQTNVVTNESDGETVDSTNQAGNTTNFPLIPGTLVITLNFGGSGIIVMSDLYSNNSMVMTTNTTSFPYVEILGSIDYLSGAWTITINYSPLPAGGVITQSYTYTTTTGPTYYSSTRILPAITPITTYMVNEPYTGIPFTGPSGVFSGITFSSQGLSFPDIGPMTDVTTFSPSGISVTAISGITVTPVSAIRFNYEISGSWSTTSSDSAAPYLDAANAPVSQHNWTVTIADDSGLPMIPGGDATFEYGPNHLGFPITGLPWFTVFFES
jgi:hypothetical protein